MDSYTNTIEKMQKLIDNYASLVNLYSNGISMEARKKIEVKIEDLISLAAENGMSKDELDELAGTEW